MSMIHHGQTLFQKILTHASMGKGSTEMNLDALVKGGCPPWAPAPGVHDIDPWHVYNIPTAGTFVLESGRTIVFTLVGEPDDRLTVWAYLEAPTDLDTKSLFASTQALDDAINRLYAGHSAVFALADSMKIWRWTPMNVEQSVIAAATSFLRGIRESLASEGTTDPGTRFRAELASVEVETAELVDA